ncbi:MAG: hypothetical protein FJZ01_26440 [Candidatus Sericytochromatia bacterium]|nr:hypothetical protein [Candidatus Tanganyikabacteria bacterium]
MSPRFPLALGILALGPGCAAQPAGPAAPSAAVRAEIAADASAAAGAPGEGGNAFYVGTLDWQTATSSTWEWPAPEYQQGNRFHRLRESSSIQKGVQGWVPSSLR